jgi:hypothetical protein
MVRAARSIPAQVTTTTRQLAVHGAAVEAATASDLTDGGRHPPLLKALSLIARLVEELSFGKSIPARGT